MTFKDRSRAYRNDLSFSKRVPDGDAISRNICDHCGLINYENPKIV
ncbi:MAG: NUDIX hydrolase, partial [Pseudomonadota bacterium]|nr:NUDIX hydrolase [Pseudomonadota bacterium]